MSRAGRLGRSCPPRPAARPFPTRSSPRTEGCSCPSHLRQQKYTFLFLACRAQVEARISLCGCKPLLVVITAPFRDANKGCFSLECVLHNEPRTIKMKNHRIKQRSHSQQREVTETEAKETNAMASVQFNFALSFCQGSP